MEKLNFLLYTWNVCQHLIPFLFLEEKRKKNQTDKNTRTSTSFEFQYMENRSHHLVGLVPLISTATAATTTSLLSTLISSGTTWKWGASIKILFCIRSYSLMNPNSKQSIRSPPALFWYFFKFLAIAVLPTQAYILNAANNLKIETTLSISISSEGV